MELLLAFVHQHRRFLGWLLGAILFLALSWLAATTFLGARFGSRVDAQQQQYTRDNLRSTVIAQQKDATINQLRGVVRELTLELNQVEHESDSLRLLFRRTRPQLPAVPPRYRPGPH